MVSERLLRGLEIFTRLLGVGVGAAGLLLVPSSPIIGVPLIGIGLLFALRPYIAAELVELVASLF